MPVSKLIAKEERRKDTPTYQEPAIANLCEMLHKRIPQDILEPDIAKKMVIYSGGVVRELMRLCNQCCRICLRQIRRNPEQEELKVDLVVLDEAIKKLRQDFEITLGKQEYEILKETYENFLPDDPKEEAFLKLLHGLDVLEYRNNEVWYDVHPIVTDLLRIKRQIDANS
jgi:hypothetical protein